MQRTNSLLGAVAALGLLAACQNDELLTPPSVTPIDPLFGRYVSMGNSITAGFQSGGIVDSTQLRSYAALLATAMQSPFYTPLMSQPGCPPLFTNVFTQTRTSPIPCALRKAQTPPPPFISNVAVPGAEVMDGISNLDTASNANALTMFFLGGLTQIQMVERARPTFVSVWLGNNDVRGAAMNPTNAGDSTKITSVALFQARYGALLDSIARVSPRGAVLIGVGNVTSIPYFSRGSVYFAIKAGFVPGVTFPTNFQVDPATCAPAPAPGDTVLVPFPFGAAKLDSAVRFPANTYTLVCSVPEVIVPKEYLKLVGAVTAYNAYVSTQAAARGWAYLDPNPTFDSLQLISGANPPIRPFPLIGQPCTTSPFGTAFSCDALHPSTATHKLIANKLREAINAKYGTAIPAIP